MPSETRITDIKLTKRGRKKMAECLKKKQVATRIAPEIRLWLKEQKYMPQAQLVEKALRNYKVILEAKF